MRVTKFIIIPSAIVVMPRQLSVFSSPATWLMLFGVRFIESGSKIAVLSLTSYFSLKWTILVQRLIESQQKTRQKACEYLLIYPSVN